jgi:hypothetical protein
MHKFKTIKELHDAVKTGKIDESKLEITLDNDCTFFACGPTYDEDTSDDIEEKMIIVQEANGYSDIEHLYPLLFPKATVNWC